MAKKSKIARNEQRKVVVDRYAAKRAELKKALVDPTSTDEQRECSDRETGERASHRRGHFGLIAPTVCDRAPTGSLRASVG